jgi:uncharacterized protein YndB with AHSA1/START domain
MPVIVTTPSDREIVVTRTFEAPRELVFLCFSKPELVRRWLGPADWTMPVCDIDFRVGGKWRFVLKSPQGFELGSRGVYREIDPPVRIVNTELYDMDWTGGETIVTVTFAEADGRTTATTAVLYSSQQARDAAAKTPMTTGMETSYRRLDELLADPGI